MDLPRIGVSLPHVGPHAGPDAVVTVAQAADRLGFHAVSVSERLLLPLRDDWRNDADLPDSYAWEPLEVLAWAAAHTSRVRLTTGVVNAIFQPPIVLARRLATLDRLSLGRVVAGLGQGGGGSPATNYLIPEEFVAAGVPVGRRGRGFAEHVAAMRACWGPDPVEFHGTAYEVPRASVGPKPYAGTIPVLYGALTRPSVERAAREADGVIIVAVDWDEARTRAGWYRDAGGDGTVLVCALPAPGAGEPTDDAFVAGVRADLDRAAAVGADELHVTLNLGTPVKPDRQAELLAALAADLGLNGAGRRPAASG